MVLIIGDLLIIDDSAKHFKILVVGGGAGGLGAASKIARKLPKGSVGIVEPHEDHYYQPGFTLVGGGLMALEANKRKEAKLIPRDATWIQNEVVLFTPTGCAKKSRIPEIGVRSDLRR